MPQSLSSILIHLVFATKNREPFITPEVEPELHAYIAAVLRECDSPALIVGGTNDHVHILCALSRKVSVAELVEEAKKRSSKWVKTKDARLRNFQWQAGYGAFSIGRSNVNALKKYIAAQKEHHGRRSFQDEYREMLAKYGVDYDERFVWD